MAISPGKASSNLPLRAMLYDFGYPRTSSPMLYGKGSSLGFVRSYGTATSLYMKNRAVSVVGPVVWNTLPLDLRLHTETLNPSSTNLNCTTQTVLFIKGPGAFRALLQIKLWASF